MQLGRVWGPRGKGTAAHAASLGPAGGAGKARGTRKAHRMREARVRAGNDGQNGRNAGNIHFPSNLQPRTNAGGRQSRHPPRNPGCLHGKAPWAGDPLSRTAAGPPGPWGLWCKHSPGGNLPDFTPPTPMDDQPLPDPGAAPSAPWSRPRALIEPPSCPKVPQEFVLDCWLSNPASSQIRGMRRKTR